MLAVQSLWSIVSPIIHRKSFKMVLTREKKFQLNNFNTLLNTHTPIFSIELEDDSIMKKYLDAARDMTPEERGKLLENAASFTGAHQELAVEGQTDANSDEPVNHHFVAFVNHNNELYELDGRKTYPIKHGATNEDSFLQVNE